MSLLGGAEIRFPGILSLLQDDMPFLTTVVPVSGVVTARPERMGRYCGGVIDAPYCRLYVD